MKQKHTEQLPFTASDRSRIEMAYRLAATTLGLLGLILAAVAVGLALYGLKTCLNR